MTTEDVKKLIVFVCMLFCRHVVMKPDCRTIFTARCTLVQSAVLGLHVVCPSLRLSVHLSVTLVDGDYIGWNSSEIISPLVSLGWNLNFGGRRGRGGSAIRKSDGSFL